MTGGFAKAKKELHKITKETIKADLEATGKKVEKISKITVKKIAKPFIQDRGKLTLGQRAADGLARWAGSWIFIILFFLFLAFWMALNTYFWIRYQFATKPFDPYPFILLNLILSCLAAIQAPIILMSQNRAAQKDRMRAEYDYQVNRKAEREIQQIKKQLNRFEDKLNIKLHIKGRTEK